MKPCSILKGVDTAITFQWPLLLKQCLSVTLKCEFQNLSSECTVLARVEKVHVVIMSSSKCSVARPLLSQCSLALLLNMIQQSLDQVHHPCVGISAVSELRARPHFTNRVITTPSAVSLTSITQPPHTPSNLPIAPSYQLKWNIKHQTRWEIYPAFQPVCD